MRKIVLGLSAGAFVLLLAGVGYGPLRKAASSTEARQAALFQIENIEKTWHRAASTKNLNLMMSLWAPNATMTVPGKTAKGKAAIREVFAKAGPFQPQNDWLSDTPAYKIRATVNGNKGTLYFECHYIDIHTSKVVSTVGADQDVRKIKGKWLITNLTSSSVTLQP
jgi:uncharacterized protein (TIGR02246 family)